MNTLILGGGGREHALAWKLSQSPMMDQLFTAPGNAGTAALGHNVDLDLSDFKSIRHFIEEQKITLLVIGPEAPLVSGLVDYLDDYPVDSLVVIGPGSAGAQLEGSKAFAKQFMHRHGIPTAGYQSFDESQISQAREYISRHATPIVLKADGLAAGKGVIICDTQAEALKTLEESYFGGQLGSAGAQVVIEEFLDGIEFSVFILTNGQNYLLLPIAKDYKRIGEGDTGPNTGGMGAVSPVPFVDEALMDKVKAKIIEPTLQGLQEESISYSGFIFFGLIKVGDEPFVIEYNCRMGDPETEVVLPRIDGDLMPVLSTIDQPQWPMSTLEPLPLWASTVMCVSKGYPGSYAKGLPMDIPESKEDNLVLFHAGTKAQDGQVMTSGGRVIAITALAADLDTALRQSYKGVEQVNFEGKNYRRDIGKDLM